MLEINPERTVNPFGNGGLANWAVALIGLAEITEYRIHADAALGHHLLVHGRSISRDSQFSTGNHGLQNQATTQE